MDKIQEAIEKVKSLADLKQDLLKLTNQLKQLEQQHTLVSGAKMYLEQEIHKLESPKLESPVHESPLVQEVPNDNQSHK